MRSTHVAPDPNDMGAGALVAPLAVGVAVAWMTAPSLLFIVVGALLVRTPAAAPVALGLCTLGLLRCGAALASSPVEAHSAGAPLLGALGVLAVALVTITLVPPTALIVRGYALRAAPTSSWIIRAGRFAWLLALAVPILAFVMFGLAARRALRRSADDLGPLPDRSTLTLIRQARADGGPEHDELLRRGPEATHEVVRLLRSCSLNPGKSREVPHVGDMCTEGGINTLLLDLAELGGAEALAEQRRWLRATDADTVVRDHAALSLGRAGDAASLPDIAALLDVTIPVGFSWRRIDEVMTALVALHAKTEVSHIVATVRRLGPRGAGAQNGVEAVCDLDTSDGWAAYRDFATSPDAEWRRIALALFTRGSPLPPQLTQLFVDDLDDADREAAGYACLALLGPGACARYPQLCGRTHNQPCTSWPDVPDRTDLIRDAVEGRPLPAPASTAPALTPQIVCSARCSASTSAACGACLGACWDRAQKTAPCLLEAQAGLPTDRPGSTCQRIRGQCSIACLYQAGCQGGRPVPMPL